jgi:Domain of unknown function (DUF4440)
MCAMRIATLALVAGCIAVDPPPPSLMPLSSPKLDDIAWLAGTWHSTELDSHWEMVAGALYGVAFDANGFEVNIIDDSDDDGKPAPLALVSIVNGRDLMRFELESATPSKFAFADAAHRRVLIGKNVDGSWHAKFFDKPPKPPVGFDAKPGQLDPATQLQDADRAFAADTAKDGADGWARWFAPDGAMWRHNARVEGAAIKEAIAKTLTRGALQWTPVSSGAKGDYGYTLGTYTSGTGHGSYCTIWKKQAEGGWKVVFDVGRPA